MIAAPSSVKASGSGQSVNFCRALLNLASAAEAGLASTPLSNAASALLEQSERPSLRVAVVGLTPEAQSAAIRLLIGSDDAYHVCQVVAPPDSGCHYLEITLRDTGFLLDSGGKRKEFESAKSLLETLQSADSVKLRSNLAEPLRLGLAASQGRNGLTLLLPGSLGELMNKPDLFSYLSDQADVLLLAGKAADDLADEDRAIVEHLLSGIGVVQALVFTGGNGASPVWARLDATFAFPLVSVPMPGSDPAAAAAPAPKLLAEDHPEIWRLLGEFHKVRSAAAVLSLLRVRLQEEIGRCQLKRQLLEAAPAGSGGQADDRFRIAAEQLTRRASEELRLLGQSLEDQSKSSLLPTGSISQACREIAHAISSDDLALHDEDKVTKLSIKDEALETIRTRMHTALVNVIKSDEAVTNEAVTASCEDVSAQKKQLCGDERNVQVGAPASLSKVVQFAEAVLKTPLRLRGEIARKTNKQILMEIIQQPIMVIMTLLMPLSLLSSVEAVRQKVSETKLWIGELVLPPVYLLFSIYLIRELRKERARALRKELDKIRESVLADLDRWARQIFEEKKRAIGEYLGRAQDEIKRQIAEQVAAVAKQQEQRRAAERQGGMAMLQTLDRRKTETAAWLQQVDALGREVEQTKRSLQNDFSTALKQ